MPTAWRVDSRQPTMETSTERPQLWRPKTARGARRKGLNNVIRRARSLTTWSVTELAAYMGPESLHGMGSSIMDHCRGRRR